MGGPDGSAAPAADGGPDEPQPREWLIKWRDPAQAKPLPGTRMLRRLALPEAAVDVVRPADTGADTAQWLLRLRNTPELAYAEPVAPRAHAGVRTGGERPGTAEAAVPDADRTPEAWTKAHDQTELTIALIDTGVDFDHPDLKDNSVPGTNSSRRASRRKTTTATARRWRACSRGRQ